jgi:hypothetical protein
VLRFVMSCVWQLHGMLLAVLAYGWKHSVRRVVTPKCYCMCWVYAKIGERITLKLVEEK